jgi:hypothetical protein
MAPIAVVPTGGTIACGLRLRVKDGRAICGKSSSGPRVSQGCAEVPSACPWHPWRNPMVPASSRARAAWGISEAHVVGSCPGAPVRQTAGQRGVQRDKAGLCGRETAWLAGRGERSELAWHGALRSPRRAASCYPLPHVRPDASLERRPPRGRRPRSPLIVGARGAAHCKGHLIEALDGWAGPHHGGCAECGTRPAVSWANR